MTTLSALLASGWIAREGDYVTLPCDVCNAPSTFVWVQAPDCATRALAGVGGAHSDPYGVYCSPSCNRLEMLKDIEWAQSNN